MTLREMLNSFCKMFTGENVVHTNDALLCARGSLQTEQFVTDHWNILTDIWVYERLNHVVLKGMLVHDWKQLVSF